MRLSLYTGKTLADFGEPPFLVAVELRHLRTRNPDTCWDHPAMVSEVPVVTEIPGVADVPVTMEMVEYEVNDDDQVEPVWDVAPTRNNQCSVWTPNFPD